MCLKHSSVEWSSILIFKAEGSIQNPSSLKLTCTTMVPMNIGTTTYTEYSTDTNAIEYLIKHNLIEERRGKIHSHNNMNSFHSGTDDEDIIDNAAFFPYYLSVVVNNRWEWDTKIGVLGKEKIEKPVIREKRQYFMNDDNSNMVGRSPITNRTEAVVQERDVVFMFKGEIILEEEVLPSAEFISRAVEIAAPKPVTTYTNSYPNYANSFSKNTNPQEKEVKRDVNYLLSPNEAFSVIQRALTLPFGTSEDEVIKHFMDKMKQAPTIPAELEILKKIEDEFDRKYCIQGLPHPYHELVFSFIFRLKSRTWQGRAVHELVNYFEKIYQSNKPISGTEKITINDEVSEEVKQICRELSKGVWEKPSYFIDYLNRKKDDKDRTEYIFDIRKKFQEMDGNDLLSKFWLVPGFEVDWIIDELSNQVSYKVEMDWLSEVYD